MLFRNNIEPACAYCARSDGEGDGLRCLQKNRSVEPDHSCRRFRYDPLRRTPLRAPLLKNMDGADFEL